VIYQQPTAAEPLAQGDIIADCPVVRFRPDGTREEYTSRAVVLTQTCDLAQAKAKLVVVAVVRPAEEMVISGDVKPGTVRDQVRRSLVYGLYFLPEAPPPIFLPESIVNLRDLHTLPREVLEQLVASGKRVCRLATPYREHLAQHFAVTYMRIALPDPYETRP